MSGIISKMHELDSTLYFAISPQGSVFLLQIQVRHYYYRLVRRLKKLLGPDFSLDARNSKDTIAAMLRW